MLKEIVYIRTEPLPAEPNSTHGGGPIYRCTIELADGSTIMRRGLTEQHALANAIAIYKTTFNRNG